MKTPEVSNQVPDLKDVNLYSHDLPLSEGMRRAQASRHTARCPIAVPNSAAPMCYNWPIAMFPTCTLTTASIFIRAGTRNARNDQAGTTTYLLVVTTQATSLSNQRSVDQSHRWRLAQRGQVKPTPKPTKKNNLAS